MLTFASVYSGIGGMDCGFVRAGWKPLWQCEADPFRRLSTRRRFGEAVLPTVANAVCRAHTPLSLPTPDVLYGELPDSRLSVWWPDLHALARALRPRRLVVEFSPTVRCEPVLRDLALTDWAFRLVYLKTTIRNGPDQADGDGRDRAFVFASRVPADVDRIGLSANYAILEARKPAPGAARGTPEWHAETRDLPARWVCACPSHRQACACDPQARIDAVQDGGAPLTGEWVATLVDGRWQDGRERGVTRADGGMA